MSTFFSCPPEWREGLEAVKRALGIDHHYLDGWVYRFYENKKFDVKETVAKLQRRDHMEKTVFAHYTITPSLKQSMRAGIVQYIGRDKEGRPVLYFNTVRDSPTADQRPERQANMDMFLSWAVRCDPLNPSATVTWLINQQDASLLRNTDIVFQKDMALRISKFFPGVVAKIHVCNMGSALTFVMKPLLKQLPTSISDCIFLYAGGDIRRGKLLDVMDADVLPIAMGGNNDIDHQQNYEWFATTIEDYFSRCQRALQEGISIKEMEMMEAYPVGKDGRPLPAATATTADANDRGEGESAPPSDALSATRARRIREAGEETLDLASPIVRTPSKICVDRNDREVIVVMSSSPRRRPASDGATPHGKGPTSPLRVEGEEEEEKEAQGLGNGPQTHVNGREELSSSSSLSPNSSPQSLPFPSPNSRHGPRQTPQPLSFFRSRRGPDVSALIGNDPQGLPALHVDTVEVFSFAASIPAMRLPYERVCELQRCWTLFLCHCVTLMPQLLLLMEALRDDDMLKSEVLQVRESIPLIRRVTHHILDLFPQTTQPLYYPIFHWLTVGHDRRRHITTGNVKDRMAMDCTSPDNFLLSVQSASVEYVDECERLFEEDRIRDRILRRVMLSWPAGVTYDALLGGLRTKAKDLWRQVVPLLQRYVEAKAAMSIGEFIDHYGLLASGGRIGTRTAWYSTLFSGLVQYRELHRKNWLFHVLPPPFHRVQLHGAGGVNSDGDGSPPTMTEMLHALGESAATLTAASGFMILVGRSLVATRLQLGPTSVTKIASHLTVERYMEETGTKVYIPYESQLTGLKPKELIAVEKEGARQLLEAVEQPLKEFLFVTAVMLVLEKGVDGTADTATANGGGVRGEGPPKRTEALQRVSLARRQCKDVAESRRSSRRTAMAIAKAAYEVQGTFGRDTGGPAGNSALPVYGEEGSARGPVQPDGFALALNLLLVEALVQEHVAQQAAPANESFAFVLDGVLGGRSPLFGGSPDSTELTVHSDSGAALPPGDGESTSADAEDSVDADMKSAHSAEAVDVAALIEALTAMEAAAIPLVAAKRQLVR